MTEVNSQHQPEVTLYRDWFHIHYAISLLYIDLLYIINHLLYNIYYMDNRIRYMLLTCSILCHLFVTTGWPTLNNATSTHLLGL